MPFRNQPIPVDAVPELYAGVRLAPRGQQEGAVHAWVPGHGYTRCAARITTHHSREPREAITCTSCLKVIGRYG